MTEQLSSIVLSKIGAEFENIVMAHIWRTRGVAVAHYVFRAINFRVHLRETVNPINFRLP